MRYSNKQKRMQNFTDLAEQYGESIDNLPMDILMEAIYNERNASTSSVLDNNESEEKKT
jgi:hypothetical protein